MGVSNIEEEVKKPLFAHLHNHSEYSLYDGMSTVKEIVSKAKSFGHTHVALTDHGNMFAAVDFYLTAKKEGLTPIVGCEIFHEGQEKTLNFAKIVGDQYPTVGAFHLVLLAKSSQGYKTLMKVVSAGYIENLKAVPIVSENTLSKENEDLVAIDSGRRGEFAYLTAQIRRLSGNGPLLLEGGDDNLNFAIDALAHYVETMKARFGTEDYYIEIIDNNLPGQKQFMHDIALAAKHFQLPIVATANSYYPVKDDVEYHAILTAIKNKLTKTDIRNRLKNTRFYLLNNDEFLNVFREFPEAISNTLVIAEKCSKIEIDMGKFYLPKFDLGTGETSDESLTRLAKEGLEERIKTLRSVYTPDYFSEEMLQTYHKRLEYELGVILKMGFPGYFLIVQDFINWAKSQGIPVGPGRGSGAGSLVAYALKITDLDPLPYNLIFERFLNPDRVSMPDFDVDFCQWRRDEVIQYVTKKYGVENVAQITTYGKLKAKAAIKSAGRALDLGYSRVDKFTKLFPDVLDISIKDAFEQEPQLQIEVDKDDMLKDLMRYARRIEGLTNHTSVHAAGVVISDGAMTKYVPVHTTDGVNFITQYEMKKAELVGLVKFDFLGLKTLTVVQKAVDFVRESIDPKFDIATISMHDKEVYDFISSGRTCGLFQLEGGGMTRLVTKLQPSNFEDIVALVALFRPGPLGSGMVDDFVERKHGRQEITYPHPDLEPILKDTYGMIVYQEQVQKIAAVLANYTLGEADLLRRAMGKKIPAEMAKQKSRFLSGAAENKIDAKIAEDIFDLMAKFAEYGFNKSHSAAYGLVTYQTAFLKTHFTEQFMAAIMTCDLDNTTKLIRYIEDCIDMGFKILPPNINRSFLDFDVPKPKQIGFGLAAIKGIGTSVLKPIVDERQKNGKFKDLTSFAKRVDLGKVGKKTLELLTQAGALDDFGYTRRQLFSLIKDVVTFSINHFEAKNKGQKSLFDFDESPSDNQDNAGAPWDSQYKIPLINGKPFDNEDLFNERKLLGVFLTGHPLDLYAEDMRLLKSPRIKDFNKYADANKGAGRGQKQQVGVIALLSNQNQRRNKQGKLMASLKLEQQDASFEATMWEEAIQNNKMLATDTPVVAYGIIDRSFDQTTLRFTVERILPLEDVRQERVKCLKLNIKTDEVVNVEYIVRQLRKTVESSRGPTPIQFLLKYKDSEVTIKSDKIGVELTNQLISNLQHVPFKEFQHQFL